MTRYFYTDPLAAAWMAKHFGMRFAVNPQVIQQHFDLIDPDAMDENFNAPATNGDTWLFHVHPDSLHLLEPIKGDEYLLPRWKTSHLVGYRTGIYNGIRKERGCQLHGDRIGDEYYFADTPNGHAQPFTIRDSVPERRNVADLFKAIGFPRMRNGKAFHWPDSEPA